MNIANIFTLVLESATSKEIPDEKVIDPREFRQEKALNLVNCNPSLQCAVRAQCT